MHTLTAQDIDFFANKIFAEGYVRISPEFFIAKENIDDVIIFQKSSFDLAKDQYGGQRYRAHSLLLLADSKIYKAKTDSYVQARAYNYTHGDVERKMENVNETVLALEFFKKILHTDIDIAKNTALVDFTQPVRIGLHQIRYLPILNEPSYASPPWLHKDEEAIVFTHLVGASFNIIGGDNVLADDATGYQEVLRLSSPFDTLVVANHKQFHAVTPLSLSSGQLGYRDIFLVTFSTEPGPIDIEALELFA